jgi:hypothetical protein
MILKSALRAIDGFPVGVRRGEDLAAWAQIAMRYRIAWSPASCAIYHLSADNRASHIHPAHSDVPGAAEMERFLEAGNQPVSSPNSIKEYLAFMRLSLGKHHCLTGQKHLAIELLAKTRSTVLWARKRRQLMYMVFVPSALLRTGIHSKALVRTTLNSFASRHE